MRLRGESMRSWSVHARRDVGSHIVWYGASSRIRNVPTLPSGARYGILIRSSSRLEFGFSGLLPKILRKPSLAFSAFAAHIVT